VAHLERDQADPTVRAAILAARTIHADLIAVRFTTGVRVAAPADSQTDADALHRRALERASRDLVQLRAAGPLPSDDPHLPELRAALVLAGLPTGLD
jgi:hypothetical protein